MLVHMKHVKHGVRCRLLAVAPNTNTRTWGHIFRNELCPTPKVRCDKECLAGSTLVDGCVILCVSLESQVDGLLNGINCEHRGREETEHLSRKRQGGRTFWRRSSPIGCS